MSESGSNPPSSEPSWGPPSAPPPPAPDLGPPPQGYGPPPEQQAYGAPPPGQGYGAPAAPSPYGQARPPLAEWPKRVGATLIDQFLPFVAVFIVAAILGAISDVLGAIVGLLGYLAAFGWAIYQSYLTGATGQSFGKQKLGIRVLSEQTGQPIGGGMGIARYFIHFVDSLPCIPLGYLWPLWDQKKQTFTDKILSTVVIDEGAR